MSTNAPSACCSAIRSTPPRRRATRETKHERLCRTHGVRDRRRTRRRHRAGARAARARLQRRHRRHPRGIRRRRAAGARQPTSDGRAGGRVLAPGACGIYNTTKFAVRGLSESLRASLAPHGIGVSVLCPGLVKSYIYASDEVRPAGLKAGAKPVDAEAVKRLAAVHEFGMEPDVVAARVLQAMREDRFPIFSHPEVKDELREEFAEILGDFRDYPVDPGHNQRVDFEKTRRASYRQQRKGLKAS